MHVIPISSIHCFELANSYIKQDMLPLHFHDNLRN